MRDTPLDTAPAVARAVAILRRGGLVAFPTETVYGLGADAGNEAAVRRIFAVKQRPVDHPVIVHIPDASHLPRWAARVPEAAARLAAAFWPGPLTLVLERAAGVLDAVTGGQDSVGVRVPYHPLALDLLHAFGGGLAAPSANLFGCLSPTSAEHVLAELGDQVDLVLDGGACRVGIESTIVEVNGSQPRLLRPGGIGLAAMEAVVGSAILLAGSDAPRAPGRLASHYAPRTAMTLVEPGQLAAAVQAAVQAGRRPAVFSRHPLPPSPAVVAVRAPSSAAEYARVLYRTLRRLDDVGADLLLVEAVPDAPDWLAVRDRLARAASHDLGDDEP
ncbi:MAG: threonylcarbamoyl-AMP synthase [Betaproteobacteria bacterium]|nr:threonylcarbamoyl-AMP synthase [Betaproteobacteria bacterium]